MSGSWGHGSGFWGREIPGWLVTVALTQACGHSSLSVSFLFGRFETESQIALAGPHLPSAGTTGVCHHTWPRCVLSLAQLKG